MKYRHLLASGAAVAVTLCSVGLSGAESATAASGTLPTVSVRIEGASKTLLPTQTATLRGGYLTKYGASPSTCAYASAQGALDIATHGNWQGSWNQQYKEYFITGIEGVTPHGKSYWELFVNHQAASVGACDVKLNPGDQVLFAQTPTTGATVYATGLTAPARARKGKPFSVKVIGYKTSHGTPLAGAVVTAGKLRATTNAVGVARLTEPRAGQVTVTASKSGYIRAAATVAVKAAG